MKGSDGGTRDVVLRVGAAVGHAGGAAGGSETDAAKRRRLSVRTGSDLALTVLDAVCHTKTSEDGVWN